MAGIYIHIPFCRQACRYCDFHFEVSVWNLKDVIPCIIQELEIRKDYLGQEEVETIYFGGGTPSVLDISAIRNILNQINRFYKVKPTAEISFEANPEDLNTEYLANLISLGINRLSIGIQSFDDRDLELMHRIHDSAQAVRSVKHAKEAGFENINIDLIYGLPRQEEGKWDINLEKAFILGIEHLSAYHLTYESGTVFDHWRKKGRLIPLEEEESLLQYKKLVSVAAQAGFEHYEVSNFSKPGYQSQHNKSYWEQKSYLGLGPSAHSYNGKSRSWNIRNNGKYTESIKSKLPFYETENLSENDLFNEYIMTGLRTRKGIQIKSLREKFGDKRLENFNSLILKYLLSGHVIKTEIGYELSDDGIFISDRIISDLFVL